MFGTEERAGQGPAQSSEVTGLGEDALEAGGPSYAGDGMSAWPRGLLVGFVLIKAQLPKHRSRAGE